MTTTIDIGTNFTFPQARRGPFPAATPLALDFAVANDPALTKIALALNLAQADLQNAALSLCWAVFLVNADTSDGELVWGCAWPNPAGCWAGGTPNPRTGTFMSPAWDVTGEALAGLVGKTCRLKVIAPVTFTGLGGSVSVT